MSAALNLRSARHLGGAHDDAEQISQRAAWGDAPGVDISVTLFRRGEAASAAGSQAVAGPAGIRPGLAPAPPADHRARPRAARRAAEGERAGRLAGRGPRRRNVDDPQARLLRGLVRHATRARTVVAARVA